MLERDKSCNALATERIPASIYDNDGSMAEREFNEFVECVRGMASLPVFIPLFSPFPRFFRHREGCYD